MEEMVQSFRERSREGDEEIGTLCSVTTSCLGELKCLKIILDTLTLPSPIAIVLELALIASQVWSSTEIGGTLFGR